MATRVTAPSDGRLHGHRTLTLKPTTLVFHIFGALAQFERDLIHERTSAGLKAAEARGKAGGRRPAVTPDKLAKARAHLAAGRTVREAAARVKVGKTALYKALGGLASTAVG